MTFNQQVGAFMAVCEKRRNYGATDTEPQEIFRSLIRRVLRGKPYAMPKTADDWELYTSDSSEKVAEEMTAAALPCVEAAKQAAPVYAFVMD